MLKLKKIAVTGGLAVGKSTVCQFFRELGAYVVSADEIVHKLLSSNTGVIDQVIRLLGRDILSGREIDRKKIAEKVFFCPDKLRALEQIIHPAVFNEIEKKYKQIKEEGKYRLFVAEVPLLYETNAEGLFDAVLAVASDPALCKQRFLQDKQHTETEFHQRMTRQLDQEKKARRANYICLNNSTVEALRAQVEALFPILTS